MILVIDNYDSFTFNLVQYIGSICKDIEVIKDGTKSIEDLIIKDYTHIILSPGPGRPDNTKLCNKVIKTLSTTIPTLGICLGHQAIAYNLGAPITYSKNIMHGKTSVIIHNNTSKLFKGIPKRFNATRYHSLVVLRDWTNDNIKITSRSDDGEIMSFEHKKHPLYGIQFHPESIMTEYGMKIIENFIK